jgi:hypothetical protein
VFYVAFRYSFQDRKVAYKGVDTVYENSDAQSDDEIFITNINKKTVTVESQQDAADDLFDSLLEGHKKEGDKGPVHRDTDNSHHM